MKIDETIIETTSELEEQSFSIENTAMLFDILRNKMYSDNIAAICREISCNARDAHREIGKAHIPIEITLPTYSDPYIKFKDFGPGISPERMNNVFIKYTASTKRSDNTQTGGFGLGAKTPFSYSDQFTIVTIVDGIQYNYLAYIDESKIGKMTLLTQIETSEENGTEIIIPVKNGDDYKFRESIIKICKFWQVKPFVKGLVFQDFEKHEFNNTFFVRNQSGMYSTKVHILIDDIDYILSDDCADLKQAAMHIRSFSKLYDIYLKFNTGELSLVANREQLDYDESTIKLIAKRINDTISFIRNKIKEDVSEADSIFDALRIFNDYRMFDGLTATYKDVELTGTELSCINWNLQNVKIFRDYLTFSPKKKLLQINSVSNRFSFDEKSAIVFNDLKELHIDNFSNFFQHNPEINAINLVSFKEVPENEQEKRLRNLVQFDEIEILKASEIYNHAKIKEFSLKLTVFEFTDKLNRTSIKKIPYTGKKVLGTIKGGSYVFGDLVISDYLMKAYIEFLPETNFFIVKTLSDKAKLESRFKFSDLSEIMSEKVKDINEDVFFVAFLDKNGLKYDNYRFTDLPVENIKDPDLCNVIKYLNDIDEIRSKNERIYYNLQRFEVFNEEKYNELAPSFESITMSTGKIQRLVNNFAVKYPLLTDFSRYSASSVDNSHKVDYINWIHNKGN